MCELCRRRADLLHGPCGRAFCASCAVEADPLHCPECGESWLPDLDVLEEVA